MCGITGFFALTAGRSRSEMHVIGQNMAKSIAHRGPDSHDLWQDPDLPLVLVHRRLSILDLSEDGAQPMMSASERYVLIYNGEIYNYLEIQKELEKSDITFRGRSDTEVILGAIEKWGLNRTLQKLNGMFAFALWDRKEKLLHFARDRLGKKPLYIGWAKNTLIFGSELKALRVHPDFNAELDPAAVQEFIALGYIEAPRCIYKNIVQLPPANRLSIALTELRPAENISQDMKPYWDAASILEDAKAAPNTQSNTDIIDEFESLLSQCVQDRMISDVPLGAFLSGGIDSSCVVALMQAAHSNAIKTYSIGFEDAGFNESPHARAIAEHLGTDHHEHICTAQDALDVIPLLPDMYDEPFADISAIPTYLVSKFARGDVTVAISGDGGDEMLGGYSRHVQGPKLWSKMQRMPRIMRSGLSAAIQHLPVGGLNALNQKHAQFGTKLHKAASVLSLDTQEEVYLRLLSKWPEISLEKDLSLPRADLSFAEKMMYWDTVGYLPNDILTKVDRASMAVSLEARAPLLDKRIYEYVWRLPEHLKIQNSEGKWLLRQVLKRHVPEKLFTRPKQGFSIPVASWLLGPLKEWAEDLLDDSALNASGLLDQHMIKKSWQAHSQGHGNYADGLWNVLMLQAWYKRWM
ncbi:MAG: asparagine synthase (glutamine-hydrolyzing) [Pseudomonadota bacterium]